MISQTHPNLIDKIVKDGRYKSICKGLVGNKRHLADDLYQESMMAILELKDDRLFRADAEGRLEVFIVGLINNIWHNRNRAKSYGCGSTSPLMEYSSTFNIESLNGRVAGLYKDTSEIITNDTFDSNKSIRRVISQTSLDYNPKIDQVFEATKKIVREDCHSNETKVWYPARVYNYSSNDIAGLNVVAFDNPRQFAKDSKIPYSSVYKTYCLYKQSLQQRLKHFLND